MWVASILNSTSENVMRRRILDFKWINFRINWCQHILWFESFSTWFIQVLFHKWNFLAIIFHPKLLMVVSSINLFPTRWTKSMNNGELNGKWIQNKITSEFAVNRSHLLTFIKHVIFDIPVCILVTYIRIARYFLLFETPFWQLFSAGGECTILQIMYD